MQHLKLPEGCCHAAPAQLLVSISNWLACSVCMGPVAAAAHEVRNPTDATAACRTHCCFTVPMHYGLNDLLGRSSSHYDTLQCSCLLVFAAVARSDHVEAVLNRNKRSHALLYPWEVQTVARRPEKPLVQSTEPQQVQMELLLTRHQPARPVKTCIKVN